MNFSQNTLIDIKQIFKIIPQRNTAKRFTAFNFLVMPQPDSQLVRYLLLGQTGGIPGGFQVLSHTLTP